VKKNPGKKGQGKSVEVEGENLSKKSTFKLSEIVSDKAEVAVIANNGDDLRNNNNNCSRNAKGDNSCRTDQNLKREENLILSGEESKMDKLSVSNGICPNGERVEGIKLEDSSELKNSSDISDSSGFQEMSSSLSEKQDQDSQHLSAGSSLGLNNSCLENSITSLEPGDDHNRGFIDASFEEKREKPEKIKNVKTKTAQEPPRLTQSHPSIEDFVNAGVPRRIAMMKHPLQNTWTFWYQKLDAKKNWDDMARRVVDVSTVEDFWQVYHHLEPACNLREGHDYLLFKKGICPDWSDPLNKEGGRLIHNMKKEEAGLSSREVLGRKERLEAMWLELLLLLIGEQAGPESDLINGAAVNKKKNDRLAIWLRHGDMKAVTSVGNLMKRRLQLESGGKQVYFQAHDHGCLENFKKRNNSYYNPSPAKTFI